MATEKDPVPASGQSSNSSGSSSRSSSLHSIRVSQAHNGIEASHYAEGGLEETTKSNNQDVEKNLATLTQTPTNHSKTVNGNNINTLDTVRSHVSQQDMHASENVYREQNAEQYLRFSPTRKVIIVTILACCSFLAPISSTSILPAIPEVAATFNTTGSIINASNAVFMVFMGLSSTFWGTFSQILGRRPVSI